MSRLELVVYQDVQGWQPFEAWFERLDIHAATKVTAALQRMAAGNLSDVKSVGAGVLERRIDWGPGYRVYFGRDTDRLVVLLAGGTKKRQQRDIEEAQGGGRITSGARASDSGGRHHEQGIDASVRRDRPGPHSP